MDPSLQAYLSDQTTHLLDFIYDGVYVVDRDRNIVYWNRGAERLTGHGADLVRGRCCRDNLLNHIDDDGVLLCESYCPLQKSLDTGESTEAQVWPLHADGHRFPVEAHIGPIRGGDGRIIGAIEVFRDKTAELRYRQIEEKFRTTIHRYVSDLTFQAAEASAREQDDAVVQVRDLTVLFVDIVGFTPMAEALGPERTVELLNGFFGAASLGVRLHFGDIDKFIGDCALALFRSADDAVQAAGEFLAEGLPNLNRTLSDRGLPPIEVRIGINSGPVVQGTIGDDERRDWTVIGDVVNTANRVEGATPPGEFRLTEATRSRLATQDRFVFDREVSLKGKAQPVRLYGPV